MHTVQRFVRLLFLSIALSTGLTAHTLLTGKAGGHTSLRPTLSTESQTDSTTIDSTDIRYVFPHIPDKALDILSLRTSPDLWKGNIPAEALTGENVDTAYTDSTSLDNYLILLDNDFGEECELTLSPDDELCVKLTSISTWKMRRFPTASGSLFIRIHTLHTAGGGSRLKAYRTDLTEDLSFPAPCPKAEEFLTPDTFSSPTEKSRIEKSLYISPVYFTFTKDTEGQVLLTATLGTEGLSQKALEFVRPRLHPIHYRWDGNMFRKPQTTIQP